MSLVNRRDALKTVGASVGALLVAGAAKTANAAASAQVVATLNPAKVPGKEAWKFAPIDPDQVAKDAYDGYKKGHCMNTTFVAIVTNVAKALKKTDPAAAQVLESFPFHMFNYGASGANGNGTLCGSVNGAMSAVNLFVSEEKTLKAILNEVSIYYERTMLPIYKPEGEEDEAFPQTISNSILCHVSSGKWCALAQVQSGSPERTERCTRLTADIAKKTAELLNLNVAAFHTSDVAPVVTLKRTQPTSACITCHDKGGSVGNIIGKMTCTECHDDKTPDNHQ